MDDHSHEDPNHIHTNGFPKSQVVVVVVPFPCQQSHLNQLLQLSCLISAHKIPVHYATSATHLRQARLRFTAPDRLAAAQIHFHYLPTPPFHSPPPNPNSPFPSHLQPSFDSSLQLRHPMAALLREISASTAGKVIVIHDLLMAYVVQDISTLPNAESYAFSPIAALNFVSLDSQLIEKDSSTQNLPVPERLPSTGGCTTKELQDFLSHQTDFLSLASGTIFNSTRSIEGTYIDSLVNGSIDRYKKTWAIGPLNQWMSSNSKNSNTQHQCLDWLNKQAPKSVIYVSFGTVTSIADEQIKEIAIGLEQSGQKFIWVLREADRGDIFAGDVQRMTLPEGYEDRVREVGLVVRDWAPQVEILGHPSTGGFMSHCGWNSFMESITMGIPIAAWPMHSDQPKISFLITDILKVGLMVSRGEHLDELVTSSTIAGAVKRLMASKEGEEMRKRAEELGDATRRSVEQGGVSRMELDSFIAHITR